MSPEELFHKLQQACEPGLQTASILGEELIIPVEGGMIVFNFLSASDAGSWYFEPK